MFRYAVLPYMPPLAEVVQIILDEILWLVSMSVTVDISELVDGDLVL